MEARKKQRGKEGEGERELFYFLFDSPNGCSGCSWAGLTSGTRNSTCITHMGDASPDTWAILHCIPRHVTRELDQKHGNWDLSQHTGEMRVVKAVA